MARRAAEQLRDEKIQQIHSLEYYYGAREWRMITKEFGEFDFSEDTKQAKHLQMVAEAFIALRDINRGQHFALEAWKIATDTISREEHSLKTAKSLYEHEYQEEALIWLDKIDINPHLRYISFEAKYLKGECFYELNLPNEAAEVVSDILDFYDKDFKEWYNVNRLFANSHAKIGRRKNVEIAREIYRKLLVVRYDPELAERVRKIDLALNQGKI